MLQNIGNMIFSLREKSGISQKNLARGIISVPELSRIESGEKETDKFVLEALLQRLGKSMDKLEMAVSNEEYELVFLRTLIFENLKVQDYKATEIFLEEYRRYPDSSKPLHRQYLLQMEALNKYVLRKNRADCIQSLEQALTVTIINWEEEQREILYLCTQEIQLLLIIQYLLLDLGQNRAALHNLYRIFIYLEQHYTDEEEKAKVYPQCAWLLGKAYLLEGKTEKAYEVCEKGKECLSQNGVLTVMDALLRIEESCLRRMNRVSERENVACQRKALRFLYEIAEYSTPEEELLNLLIVSGQSELLISNELIKELRLAKNLSQVELSEDICSWETLSRIEGGRSPNRKNLYKMLEKMNSERGIYYGFIISNDYVLYEKVRKSKRNWFEKDVEQSYILTEDIANELDMNIPLNKQFVESSRLMYKIAADRITMEEAIEELYRILQYTMNDFSGFVYRIPFRQECVILNQIALCLKKTGKREDAISLYEQILEKFQKSKVAEQYHSVSEMLLYLNYAGTLEEANELEKAQQAGKRGIKLSIECQRGDIAAIMLANISCVFEKSVLTEDEKMCELCLRNSYFLLQLYAHEKDSTIIKRYYEQKYKKELD